MVEHPVTVGVTWFGTDYHREFTTVGPALDLVSGAANALGAADGVGVQGNVVFLGDSTMWNDPLTGTDHDINSLGNRVLLSNILAHIAP